MITWPLPSSSIPPLTRHEVHLWCARLNLSTERIESRRRLLSKDELLRSQRFHFVQDQERFIVSRGTLRLLLGHYLDLPPTAQVFCYNAYGKPYLKTAKQTRLCFNVSHSAELALYVVAHDRAVGVDLERIRVLEDMEQLAGQFFSKEEAKMLRSLPLAQWPVGFFNCWTRKEAYIKARGFGLSLPLDQFDVSLRPGEPALLLATRPHPQEASHWTLQSLNPAPGYIAALAVEGTGWTSRCRQWPEGNGIATP